MFVSILGGFSFAYCVTDSILSIYLKNIGLNSIQISLMFSALMFSFIVSSSIIGGISEFVSKKYILLSSIFLSGISYIFLILGKNYFLFILSQIILGIGVSGVMTISMSEFEKYIKKERGFRTGVNFSVQYLGKFFGPLSGGIVAFMTNSETSILFSIFSFLILFVVVYVIYHDKKSMVKIKSHKDFIDVLLDFRKFEKNKDLFFASIVGFLEMFLIDIKYVFIPILLVEMGLPFTEIGIIVASFYLLSSIEVLFTGKILDKIRLGPMMIISTILFALSFIFIFISENFIMLFISALISSFAVGALDVSTSEAIFTVSKKRQEENYGFYLSFSRIGGLVGFLISGFLVQMFGVRNLFLIAGISSIIFFAIYIINNKDVLNSNYLF